MAQEFVIQAVVMHHGHTLHSGHYTLSMHASDMTFFCDDGVLPQPRPQPDTGRHYSDAAYMFLCRRLDPGRGPLLSQLSCHSGDTRPHGGHSGSRADP